MRSSHLVLGLGAPYYVVNEDLSGYPFLHHFYHSCLRFCCRPINESSAPTPYQFGSRLELDPTGRTGIAWPHTRTRTPEHHKDVSEELDGGVVPQAR